MRSRDLLAIVAAAPLAALVLVGCGDADELPAPDPASAGEPAAPFEIRDASARAGIDFVQRSGTPLQRHIVEVKATGVGLLDYDRDGLLDVVLTAGSTLDRHRSGRPGFGTRLYRNLGALRFEDVTAAAGVPATGWACAPICADYDGDGWVDLYLTHVGRNRLLRNVRGRFEDVTERSGLGDTGWGTSAVFHDLDADGDLDLYLCNYLEFDFEHPPEHGRDGRVCEWKGHPVACGPKGFPPQADRCFRNDGDGRFTDVSRAWGLEKVPAAYALGVLAGDLDGDGRPEIYVANDGMPNAWLDAKDGGLEENGYFKGVAFSEGGAPQAGMGLDAADLNGDGEDDLVCTNFSGEVNNVYLSLGDGSYREAAAASGTALAGLDALGWGVGLRDFDLDGRLDLFVACGHVYPEADRVGTSTSYPQLDLLFLGRGGARFSLVDHETMSAFRTRRVSRGVALGDLDDDGDVDLVVANLNARCSVLETHVDRERLDRHFVGLRLLGRAPNPDAIGARVTLATPSRERTLEVRRHASFQASHDPRLVFGLGAERSIRKLAVRWPDGRRETFDATVDAYTTLRYGSGRS